MSLSFVNDKIKIYLVGGAVRDQLLKLPVKEKDWVVVGASANILLKAGFKNVGKDFPVFLHPITKEEYALARIEKKVKSGYTGFAFDVNHNVSLEDDLARRDLTINAIAQDDNGNYIDPFNGIQDIQNKILRHVTAAFTEDPLRVLRVARFAARFHQLGFQIAEETMQLMRDIVQSKELLVLTAERVWLEIYKALQTQDAYIFFTVLRECGALKQLLPEIDNLYGVPNPARHHPEIDSGVHTMLVLKQACLLSNDVGVRFAALFHDVGKSITDSSSWPKHHNHENLGVQLVKAVNKRLKLPKKIAELALLVTQYHGLCHCALELRAVTIHKLFSKVDAWRRPERFEQILLACEADSKGCLGKEKLIYKQGVLLRDCLQACLSIDIRNIISQITDEKKIANQIREERIQVIQNIIDKNKEKV